jgi:hypothetical protein
VTAVTYINDMGGMASEVLDKLANKVWNWCIDKNIYISAGHVSGSENSIADFYSRDFSNSTEWMLNKNCQRTVLARLFKKLSQGCFIKYNNTNYL